MGGAKIRDVMAAPRAALSWDDVVRAMLPASTMAPLDTARRLYGHMSNVAIGFFHAAVKDGGLGVPRLAEFIPHLRLRRLLRLRASSVAHVVACACGAMVDCQIRWCRARLANVPRPESADSLKAYWARLWHDAVDGADLSHIAESGVSTDWVRRPSPFMRGGDFVHYSWVRANSLCSRMRVTRGRRGGRDVMCRAGCQATETAGHMIQRCWILRHECIVKAVGNSLIEKGWTVHYERVYHTPVGPRKPDITAVRGNKVAIVDAQVVSGDTLNRAHSNKVAKYRDEAGLTGIIIAERRAGRDGAAARVAADSVVYATVTVSWRGVLGSDSMRSLEDLGVDRRTLRRIPIMALKGSYLNWVRWNGMT
ncbi:unnamed protein product [Phaedon cochleariae]|uniref:Reverse transcriptase n=1 Tax=Phaedon cochleariae TaxID=80249 RepID=A0A9N9SPV1_PHACE|nr:unnamed protein product [Phaedon cochleariae]